MSTFKLVVRGEVLAGHQPDQVRAGIARLFNLPAEDPQLERIFSGAAVVLKKGLDQARAQRYCATIEGVGLACAVVPERAGAVPPHVTPVQQARVDAGEEAPGERDDQGDTPQYGPALVELHKLGAGAGWDWFKEGYAYFKQDAGLWVGSIVIFWVIVLGLSLIPLLSIVVNLFLPVFVGGFMWVCYRQFLGERFVLGDIFAGFRDNLGGLVGVGALYLLGFVVIMVVFVLLMFSLAGGPAGMQAMAPAGADEPPPLPVLIILLLTLGLMIPLMMAYWFAPALVMLNRLSALQAMRLSLKGCLGNWLPFLVYGLIGLVCAIIATIPLGLGWLVLGPVMMGSMFAGYRRIYTDTHSNPI